MSCHLHDRDDLRGIHVQSSHIDRPTSNIDTNQCLKECRVLVPTQIYVCLDVSRSEEPRQKMRLISPESLELKHHTHTVVTTKPFDCPSAVSMRSERPSPQYNGA